MDQPISAKILSEKLQDARIIADIVARRPDGTVVAVTEVQVSQNQVILVLSDTELPLKRKPKRENRPAPVSAEFSTEGVR